MICSIPDVGTASFLQAPQSEAALCAEMARLAYCRKEPDFGFDQERIQKILKVVGFKCQPFESQNRPQGKGVHCFLAVGEDAGENGKLAVVAFRGTDVEDTSNLVFDVDLALEKWPGPAKVHRGFAKALEEVRPGLTLALESMGPCRSLYTGHS